MCLDQADSFCDVLQEALGAEEMTKLLSSFPCGMHNSETAVCYERDGPTAVFCILSKNARQDTHGLQAIENQFMQTAEHFKYGRPLNKLQVLRPLLQKAIKFKLPLKSSQTIVPIYDVMILRFRWMAHEPSEFKDGGKDPKVRNNCAALLDQMFMVI